MDGKRAYPRYSLHIDVVVTLEGGYSFPCAVRDFCLGGMYLQFEASHAPTGAAGNQLYTNNPLIIDFTSPRDPSATTHRLHGRIARIEPNGIGVAFTSQNYKALQLLQQLAADAGHGTVAESQAPRRADPRVRTLVARIDEQIMRFATELIEDTLSTCQDKLFQESSKARTNAIQTAYFDAYNELKKSHDRIISSFSEKITDRLRAFRVHIEPEDEITSKGEAKPTRSSLSLVEKNDFDDWLIVASIISRLETRFTDILFEMDKRLDAISVTPITKKSTPAGPYILCHAFQRALGEKSLGSEQEELIYQVLESKLKLKLDDLYGKLNQLLIDEGIIPNIEEEFEVVKQPSSGKPLTPARQAYWSQVPQPEGKQKQPLGFAPLPPDDHAAPVIPPQTPGFAPLPPDGHAAPVIPPQTTGFAPLPPDGHTTPVIPSQTTGYNQQKPASAATSSTAPGLPATGPASFSTTQLAGTGLNAIHDLMSLQYGAPAGTKEVPTEPGTYYQPADLLSILSQLAAQNKTLSSLSAAGTDITSYLTEQLQEQSGEEGIQKQMQEGQDESLRFMGNLLHYFQTDALISELAKRWVAQLEIPLLKASILDQSILGDNAHPAHQVINLIDQIGSSLPPGNESYKQQVESLLATIVERIQAEIDTNINVFADVANELKEHQELLNAEYQRNIDELIKECEAQQRLFQARSIVIKDLNQRIGDRRVPKIIIELLDAGWKNLILSTYLHKGGDSELFRTHLNVIDQLYARLTGEEPYAVPEPIPDQALIEWITRILSRSEDEDVSRGLLEQLNSLLAEEGPPEALEKRYIPRLPSGTFHPEQTGDRAKPGSINDTEWYKWLDRADIIGKGAILDYTDNEGNTQQLRLIWSDRNFFHYVFADQSGHKALELNLDEMANLLCRKKLVPVEEFDAPIVERATLNLLDDLHDQFSEQAGHDELTGLLNRRSFEKCIIELLEKTESDERRHICCYFDLDRFNLINNTCGYESGDSLLLQVSVLLRGVFGDDAIIARIGDDEFAAVVEDCSRSKGLELSNSAQESFHKLSFTCEDKDFAITASIGMVEIDNETLTVNNMLTAAESACFAAKEGGRDNIQIYNPDNIQLARRQTIMSWVGRINKLFNAGLIKLRCQKIEPLSGMVYAKPHYEILLDVYDEEGNKVPLEEFIVACEQYNRISDIDKWVIEQVFDWLNWHHVEIGKRVGSFSINLSGRSLNDRKLMEELHEKLMGSTFPADMICFEITETLAIKNLDSAAYFMSRLKETGCRFSLDDFGSGISSYSYLKSLPVDYLKIDGMFVHELATNTHDYAVVKSINEIAHVMGMETVAEYAENEILVQILRDIGLDYAQGFGVEKPRPLDSLVDIV